MIRADHDYVEHTIAEYEAIIADATAALDTPPELLDELRGRQVWIRHAGGFITRYAHLATIAEPVVVGARVRQGDIIATTGNSGTLEAAQGTRRDGAGGDLVLGRPGLRRLGAAAVPRLTASGGLGVRRGRRGHLTRAG